MTREEAEEVLRGYRPDRPRRTEQRRLQQAIDIAIGTMEAYNRIINSVQVDIRNTQRQ